MSELYCKCEKPKIVKVHISHKTYDVCSKRKGGCGCEYSPEKTQTLSSKAWKGVNPITLPDEYKVNIDDSIKGHIEEHVKILEQQQRDMGKVKWNIPRDYKLPIIGSDSDD